MIPDKHNPAFQAFRRFKCRIKTLPLVPCMLVLGACAGGGSSGSAPATVYCGATETQARPCGALIPPRETSRTSTSTQSTSPGSTDGTWDTITLSRPALKDARSGYTPVERSDSMRVRVDLSKRKYTVLLDIPGYPGQAEFDLPAQWGQEIIETVRYADGTSQSSTTRYKFLREIQSDLPLPVDLTRPDRRLLLRYFLASTHVSIGRLSDELLNYDISEFNVVYPSTDPDVYDFGALLFVHGNRTSPDAMPTLGTARYRGTNLETEELSQPAPGQPEPDGDRPSIRSSGPGELARALTLTADFARSTLRANINLDSVYVEFSDGWYEPYWTWGLGVSGETSFTAAQPLTMALTGRVFTDDPDSTLRSLPVTGSMQAAFFGPAADAIGGTFDLRSADGGWWLGAAFAADREP